LEIIIYTVFVADPERTLVTKNQAFSIQRNGLATRATASKSVAGISSRSAKARSIYGSQLTVDDGKIGEPIERDGARYVSVKPWAC